MEDRLTAPRPQTRRALREWRRAPLFLALGTFAAILGLASARTATFESTETVGAAQASTDAAVIAQGAAERLAAAIRIPTISHEDPAALDGDAFRALHAHLEDAFPLVHERLEREVVADLSLLYTWRSSDPAAPPILLLGHLDVVPVEAGTEDDWQEPPFSGRVADGFVWGRGTLDDKSAVVGMLEAVEMLLAEGFVPARTVYLAFGHDEEVGGLAGARAIAALLERRGERLALVLDEGGVIGDGIFPGLAAPVAMVGVAEKGFLSVELSTHVEGGHSSLPPRDSAIGILSAAVARIEDEPMPARLAGATRQLFERIGPRLPLAQRALFANLWLTRAFVTSRLEGNPATNAMVRTTAAPTVFHAGTKDNLLPRHARAVVNFRILTGDSISGVLEHVRRVVDDERVSVKAAGRFSAEPSALSSTDSAEFRALERAVRAVVPDAIVAPYQVVVATDARFFVGLGTNVFRFLPLRMTAGDLARMHGIDERIAVADFERAIRFYRQLVLNAASTEGDEA